MKRQNIIFPAHSMDTDFYAMTPDGDLVCFFTDENGILPEDYPTHDELKPLFAKVVRSCINDQNIKSEIERVKTQMEEDDEKYVINTFSPEILSRFSYQYESDGSGEVVENILKGDLDATGTIYRYTLSETPSLRSEKVRKAVKKYLSKHLPVIKPEKVIRFEEGESYNSEIVDELIFPVIRFLIGLENSWNKLTKKFGKNFHKPGPIALINTKLIPKMLRVRLLTKYPDSKILEDPGVYFVNTSKNIILPDDGSCLDTAIAILKLKNNSMKRCVVFIKSVDELLDFYQSL